MRFVGKPKAGERSNPTNEAKNDYQFTTATVNDIRDIKPPLEISDGLAWLWWTLGALAVLAVLLLAGGICQTRDAGFRPPPIPAADRAQTKTGRGARAD